MNNLQL